MKRALIALLCSCGVDSLPTCGELGCPDMPSGTRDEWSPCTSELCYCTVEPHHVVEACEPVTNEISR